MSIIWFLIVGAIAGWIAGELTKGSGFGLLGNIVVGIIGALLGGYIFGLLGVNVYGLLGEIVMSVIGAVVFLFILSLFRRGGARM
jgi:uncharacterized membrane protein YeaQ/YmgE (transglycosylase-associated protein family)